MSFIWTICCLYCNHRASSQNGTWWRVIKRTPETFVAFSYIRHKLQGSACRNSPFHKLSLIALPLTSRIYDRKHYEYSCIQCVLKCRANNPLQESLCRKNQSRAIGRKKLHQSLSREMFEYCHLGKLVRSAQPRTGAL